MDSRRLTLLASVAQHGSISRAAEALGFSQPALSRQISALEREAGLRLLLRQPGGVIPTEAGQALIRRGEAIAAQATAAAGELDALRSARTGRLRIAAFPTAAATLALDVLVALHRSHPGATVAIEERDRVSALRALRRGDVDLAITYAAHAEPANGFLHSTPVLQEEMLLALPASDPRGSRSLRLVDLHDEPWIIGMSGSGLITQACAAAGFTPRVAARLDNQPAIQAAVAAGVGVTLVPELATRTLHPGVAVHRLRPPRPVRHVAAHILAGPTDPLVAIGLSALGQARPLG